MTDVNKIQYILEVDKKGKKRDVQVSRIAGKFIIQDPYNELNTKDISKEIKYKKIGDILRGKKSRKSIIKKNEIDYNFDNRIRSDFII